MLISQVKIYLNSKKHLQFVALHYLSYSNCNKNTKQKKALDTIENVVKFNVGQSNNAFLNVFLFQNLKIGVPNIMNVSNRIKHLLQINTKQTVNF